MLVGRTCISNTNTTVLCHVRARRGHEVDQCFSHKKTIDGQLRYLVSIEMQQLGFGDGVGPLPNHSPMIKRGSAQCPIDFSATVRDHTADVRSAELSDRDVSESRFTSGHPDISTFGPFRIEPVSPVDYHRALVGA